ncbi:hypothetical protein NGR_b14170 (plasmid) [Sinorhizobium fredii NGR234]|uniref:Uncharacterized protein n=1 Tax=Sinorhizobium fredii (strain NBRC 101917 / NGR234) TaxID=394 RepID=C3KKD2_SINFN|nr:hypothetical protein [Sinorhizobium fredii]ACP22868.1 hypothetical protein NGR_b14170 [Sinorhizobium fredii NGR234]
MPSRDRCSTFGPTEVDLLHNIFEQILEERGVDSSGDKANEIAARLISVYQSGVRDIELLKKLSMRPRD